MSPRPGSFLVMFLAVVLPVSLAFADATSNGVTGCFVDSHTFHWVASLPDNPAPPVSPFVVETADSLRAKPGHGEPVKFLIAGNAPGKGADWRLMGLSDQDLSGTITASVNGSTFTLKHGPGERFYGAGNWKRDFSGDLTHPSGTELVENGATRVPFVWSTGGYSVLVANNQKGAAWKDENGVLTFTMPAPYIDVYVSVAPTAYGLLDAYSRLTGPAPIPPRWAFGFMMSRWGYADNADVQDKWHQFRDRKIPVDAFIYDYDWFEHDWEFNPKNFPPSTLDEMHKLGLHAVGIRKPRVNDANLELAKQSGWTLHSYLGTDLRFDIPEAAAWWWSHHAPLVKAGFDGWWNDEAEQTMDEFFQMSRVEAEGWRKMSPRRSWMINRGFAPGIQRFGAATWTGDTHGSWDCLRNQKGIMLNWSLAGMPFSSDDIGGFENDPTPELYVRWIQSSALCPVMRAHCSFSTKRWPWAFGEEALDATRKAIELRYRLIPYLYTLAEETSRDGAPLMRPLVLEYPQDPHTFNLRDEWLVGPGLLAAPILEEGGKRDVYLPEGRWYEFNTGAAVEGGRTVPVSAPLDTIPMYARAGTILPLGPVLQSTPLGETDPLEIRVYPGADGTFSLYEDEGDKYDYQQGAASRIPMAWNDKTRTLTVGERVGTFPGILNTRHLVISLPDGAPKTVEYAGSALQVQL